MVKLYSDADFWAAYRQKRRLLWGFLAATFVYVLGLAGFVTFYVLLPYADPRGTWIIVATSVLTALYMFFSFPYMGISYKRSRAYCKMLRFLSVGLKEYSVLPYKEVDDWTTRDGVDVNVAVFEVRNAKRDELMTRQIYIDGEKDFPPFKEGQFVRLVTQGNLLVEYELLEEPSGKEGD